MAARKADLPPAEAIVALIDKNGRLAVRVTPGSRVESITIAGGVLSAKVRAKPVDGAANAAVLALLARALGVPKTSLELLRGATSREKVFQLDR